VKGSASKGQSNNPPQPEDVDERAERRRRKGWPIVIILVVLIALFMMLAYWIYKSTLSDRDSAKHTGKSIGIAGLLYI
jgi:hypothetical protein